METIYLLTPLSCLFGALAAGLFGAKLGRVNSHRVAIAGVSTAFILSVIVLLDTLQGTVYNGNVYTWAVVEGIRFHIGFLIDNLTAMMMVIVTFVSLMVHIYTIGYMKDDEHNWPKNSLVGTNSYQRFFSYISLFTFAMLMLVMANNFLQLFFGWEAVGLVSYLLIGFWSNRDTAIYANMKAFLVNRVGDFGFLLGIAAILAYFGSLDYAQVFAKAPDMADMNMVVVGGTPWSVLTVICLLLFVGAMGKSAQVPLHVWLPDSMEGPTPISALIHAATMVTAGIFMVARMSPLFELSVTALSVVLIIGAITAFFMGLVGIVQNDIKRVVAYSTLSQLGYMTVALGAGVYSAAVFHLMTHAFFKALLFLAAGSVIIAMHHEQDMRKMGGLRKYMPITYWTSLIGSLALIGFPGFSGFYSKDAIIEAVHLSTVPGASIAYWLVLLGVFVTAFYSFRMFFLVFHGKERMDDHTREHLRESPWVVTIPLVALAIPALVAGYLIDPMVMGDFFKGAISGVATDGSLVNTMSEEYHGLVAYTQHGLLMPPFWLAMAGLISAAVIYLKVPSIATWFYDRFRWLHTLLDNKYYIDDFNQSTFADGAVSLGKGLWQKGDKWLIDGLLVNGTANLVNKLSGWTRKLQTGYMYHYAFSMFLGIFGFLTWVVYRLSMAS